MNRDYYYRPALFFLSVYAASWIPWFLAAYAGSQPDFESYAGILNLIGLLGPITVALVLVFGSGSEALKSDFKERLLSLSRLRPIYVMVAVLLPFAVVCLSIALSLLVGQSTDQFQLSGGPNLMALVILALVLAPLMEEMGWHGYGVDSLRAENGVLKTTLLFGLLWSVWHAPLFLISGTYQDSLVEMGNPIFVINFFVSVIPAAFIANWIYYRNDRSILAAILLHSMLNAAAVLLNSGQIAKCIATLLYAAVAAAILLADRATFAGGPRNFLKENRG